VKAVNDDSLQILPFLQRGISLLQQRDVLTELEERINSLRKVNEYLPQDHPMKARCLAHLGGSLQSRFEHLGDPTDLGEAITVNQQAVRLTPEDHRDKPGYLDSLGISFQCRFGRFGNMDDLDKAITAQQQAVRLAPKGGPDEPRCLTNLGNSLEIRFQRLGSLVDLGEAITAQQQAVRLTPDGHPGKAGRLHNLGSCFQSRFKRLGDLADLDKAITAQQQAVCLTPDGHPDKPACLDSLGIFFQCRFERLGDLADLDEAIMLNQQAVRLTSDGHPDKPGHLDSLGASFLRRFERLGNLADIDEAITAQQQAVRLTPDDHPDKPECLNNLGSSFESRFTRRGDLADLDNAITAQQQAVCLIPDGHPGKPTCLHNLGDSFRSRFQRLGELADLDEAITAQQQAVRLTPDGHPVAAGFLYDLADTLLIWCSHQYDEATIAQVTSAFSRSAKSESGPPFIRLRAARHWAILCFAFQSSETLDTCATLVDLIPRVVWLGRTVDQRYKEISRAGNIVADAVMAAIHLGEFKLALEWMEQGRSIVWGQMLQLRTPLDKLHKCHPEEAKLLERISRSLDATSVAYPDHSDSSRTRPSRSLEKEAQAHRRRAEEYDDILARIRSLPDFSEFLRPQKSESLCKAATSGPVVIINVHGTRYDALILLPRSSCISHVPLPGFDLSILEQILEQMPRFAGSMRRADLMQRHYAPDSAIETESPNVLEWLWCQMVEPILRYLKVSYLHLYHCLQATDSAHSSYESPRMVTCPTSHGV